MQILKLFHGCLLFILWSSVHSTQGVKSKKQKHEPVDFTVVKDSTMKNAAKSRDGLPKQVAINFDVLGNPVNLNLERNPKVEKAKDFVIRKSNQGIPVIVQDKTTDTQVVGEYLDLGHNAIFTLSCDKNNTIVDCDPIMEGSFVSKGEIYQMELLDDRSNARVRRDATKLWSLAKNVVSAANELSKVYGIFKRDKQAGTPSDFKEESAPVNAAFTRNVKTVRENVLPGGKKHNIEVLVVADYSVYQRFYKASKFGSQPEKDQDAKRRLKKYFSHVLNGVDMLYRGIEDPSVGISVALAGFVIADSPETSDWTTPFRDIVRGEDRDELYVNNALEELVRWAYRARNLPERDHIMLFTDYDLYSFSHGRRDDKTAGFARVGAMCDLDSASVVEDHGGFQSINTAAHELGHSLGAHHDGFNNNCSGFDQFIMTARGGISRVATRNNPWKFSDCSVNYFRRFLSRLPWRNCLTDPVDLYDREEFLEFMSSYPGQDLTPNQQCQDILGLDSYYGWGSNLGSFTDVCGEMSCFVPGADSTYRVYKAATGTSCGDKQWCIEGRCAFSEKAPPKSANCVHGDSQRRFNGGQTCVERLLDFPGRCYDPFYTVRCCETCPKLHTGVKGCEYGDKFLDCNKRFCGSRSYARDCCSTCGLAPPPIIKSVTTTTPRPPPPRPRPTRPVVTRAPPTRRTTRRTPVARPTRPIPPRRTSWRPSYITTESNVIPSGNSGYCIQKGRSFLVVFGCGSLTSMFGRDACDNSLIRRYCCEPCPKPGARGGSKSQKCVRITHNNRVSVICSSGSHFQSVTMRRPSLPQSSFQTCIDDPSCDVKYARDCYFQSKRDKCCRTCKRFEQNIKGCEYGDRIEACGRYLKGLGRSYVCLKYSEYCCASCGISSASSQEQGTISDPADKDKHKGTRTKKGPRGPKGKKRKGQKKGKRQNNNAKNNPQKLDLIGNLLKPAKRNQLLDLFQAALKGLNTFLSSP